MQFPCYTVCITVIRRSKRLRHSDIDVITHGDVRESGGIMASGIELEFSQSAEDLWGKSAVLRLSVGLCHVLVATGAAEGGGKEASSRPQLCPQCANGGRRPGRADLEHEPFPYHWRGDRAG